MSYLDVTTVTNSVYDAISEPNIGFADVILPSSHRIYLSPRPALPWPSWKQSWWGSSTRISG